MWLLVTHQQEKQVIRLYLAKEEEYRRLVVQSTIFYFCNMSGHLMCSGIFFQTMFYKTWKAKLFPSFRKWQINKDPWRWKWKSLSRVQLFVTLWKRERLPSPVFWPGDFHGLYSPWGHKDLDIVISCHMCYNGHVIDLTMILK